MLENCRNDLSRKKCTISSFERQKQEDYNPAKSFSIKTRFDLNQDAPSNYNHSLSQHKNSIKDDRKGTSLDPTTVGKWNPCQKVTKMESKKNYPFWIQTHSIFIFLYCYLFLSINAYAEGTYVKSSSISSISRSTVSCRQAGGFCEPMFGCLLNHGVVQGSCHGFLTVCCAQPTSSQHVSFEGGEDNTFSVKNRVIENTPTSLSTSASSFSPSIIFPSNTGPLPSTEHQPQLNLQVHSNSIPSSAHSERAFPQTRWINHNWVQTENSHSDVQKPDFPESLSKRTGTNVAGFYPYSNKRNFRRLLIDYGPVVNDPQCGRPVSANRRVLDGQPAGFGSFPWQALIRVGKGKCGGVLVNRRHVVTAGHCVKNKLLRSVIVTLGEYHLRSRREPLPTQEFRVVKAYVHPKFQFSPAADRYDVAVLRLARPVRYAPHIAPICLPEAGRDPAAGTHAYVAGWGALIPDDVTGPLIPLLVPEVKRPSVLQVVNVPVQTNERCEKWHRDAGIKVTIWPEMVCAGYRLGGKDSCKGDSGGPLMVQQADGRWVLIGLVSAGFSCGKPGQPGIYHRISATSDWISFYINGRDRRRALYH